MGLPALPTRQLEHWLLPWMQAMSETPQPWEENWQARHTLELLSSGPKSTIELQQGTHLVHVARQIWELRHWYGWTVRTKRLPNRVAVYELVGKNSHIEPRPTDHTGDARRQHQTELWT